MARRVGFGLGALIGLIILSLRKYVPESPRWLATHWFSEQAERVVTDIEIRIEKEKKERLPEPQGKLTIRQRKSFGFGVIAQTMFKIYRTRSVLGLSLMISKAFLYNAIFFTYAMVLIRFYHIEAGRTGIYLFPFAIGNFLRPLGLGTFFDTVGRRPMISGTYALSGLILVVTGYSFTRGDLPAFSQTALWSVICSFASAAASSAYLAVSEVFPIETGALAVSLFYSIGTGTGGIVAPWFFGTLIGTGNRYDIMWGYLLGATLMLAAAGVEMVWGVKAERRSLEMVAEPLSAAEEDESTK